jgi:hypothetical protein
VRRDHPPADNPKTGVADWLTTKRWRNGYVMSVRKPDSWSSEQPFQAGIVSMEMVVFTTLPNDAAPRNPHFDRTNAVAWHGPADGQFITEVLPVRLVFWFSFVCHLVALRSSPRTPAAASGAGFGGAQPPANRFVLLQAYSFGVR